MDFINCVHEIVLPEECPENHIASSVEEHADFIAMVMDGFHPIRCKCR